MGGDFNVAKEGLGDIDHHFPLSNTVHRSNYGSFAKSVNDLFSFYLVNGEPYLNTAHGSGLNWWDASAHFVLYLRFIQAMIDGSDHMFETLFWAGSICGSLIVMVPAVFTGQHSGEGAFSTNFLNRTFLLAAQKIDP